MEIICILDSGSTETGTKQEHGDALLARKRISNLFYYNVQIIEVYS
jgi:hypothetical protein